MRAPAPFDKTLCLAVPYIGIKGCVEVHSHNAAFIKKFSSVLHNWTPLSPCYSGKRYTYINYYMHETQGFSNKMIIKGLLFWL